MESQVKRIQLQDLIKAQLTIQIDHSQEKMKLHLSLKQLRIKKIMTWMKLLILEESHRITIKNNERIY